MSATAQPAFISSWLTGFAAFDAAHGWAVNLFLVICLAAIGIGFLSGRSAVALVAIYAGIVLCLADWLLVEDFGFFGGVGTDPNSMVPMGLVFVAGYLAMTRLPAAEAPVTTTRVLVGGSSRWERFASRPAYAFRSIAAIGRDRDHADRGRSDGRRVGEPARRPDHRRSRRRPAGRRRHPGARLPPGRSERCHGVAAEPAWQGGRDHVPRSRVRLGLPAHRGGVPPGRQPAWSNRAPGRARGIVANPVYRAGSYLAAFDRQEGLQRLSNWHFLTGSSSTLSRTWSSFGIQVAFARRWRDDRSHDLSYVIDPAGHTRYILDSNPGPGTEASKSSFAVLLADELRAVLGSR